MPDGKLPRPTWPGLRGADAPRRAKPVQRERRLQQAIVEAHRVCVVHPKQAILFAIPNGEVRDPATAMLLTGHSARSREILETQLSDEALLQPFGLGVLPGAPDLMLLLPGGRSMLIEVKTEKADGARAGVLQITQKRVRDAAQALGHAYVVIRSPETYLALLAEQQVELRRSLWQPPLRPTRLLAAGAPPARRNRKTP